MVIIISLDLGQIFFNVNWPVNETFCFPKVKYLQISFYDSHSDLSYLNILLNFGGNMDFNNIKSTSIY